MPIPSQPLNSLFGTLYFTLMSLIYLTILISARWSDTSFSFLTSQVLLPCNILLCTQLLYNLPLTVNDISLLVSNGTNCLNLFHPIWILASTAASYLDPHSTSHINSKTYPLTPDLHWHQIYTFVTCTGYWIEATSTNKWPTLWTCYHLYHYTSCVLSGYKG